jgi:hypothetical protein
MSIGEIASSVSYMLPIFGKGTYETTTATNGADLTKAPNPKELPLFRTTSLCGAQCITPHLGYSSIIFLRSCSFTTCLCWFSLLYLTADMGRIFPDGKLAHGVLLISL